MIRVNLARNRAQAPGVDGTSTNFSPSFDAGDTSEQRAAIRNLFILFIGVIALIVYEKYNAFTLNDANQLLVQEQGQLEMQLGKDKSSLDQYKTSETDAKALEDKLSIIKKLSRTRLREVKALDYIQEIIPDKVWLKQLMIDQEMVKISGYSMLDEDLSTFIQTLDKSAYFQNVILTQASEVSSKSGNYKQFDISARLEMEP